MLTKIQFGVAIWMHIARAGNLTAKQAHPRMQEAWRAFSEDNKVEFGDPAYAWDDDAALAIATEYEIAHW